MNRYDNINDLPDRYKAQAKQKIAAQNAPADVRQQAKKDVKEAITKYGNIKTQLGDIKFDSRKEAKRFIELKAMLEAGEIRDLHLQQSFELLGSYKDIRGESHRGIRYVADFTYWKDNEFIIEDVKSEITRKNPVYTIKRKLMADKGWTISEV